MDRQDIDLILWELVGDDLRDGTMEWFYGELMKHYDGHQTRSDQGVGMSSGHRKRQSFEERYWLKAVKNGPNDCWGWNGAIDGHGYGHLASRDNP